MGATKLSSSKVPDSSELDSDSDLLVLDDDKDELAEMFADDLDNDYDSMSEWFDLLYGRNWAREMADTLKNYMDYEECAKYVVDNDGIENTLARYDGKSHSEKVNGVEYYIYRTN